MARPQASFRNTGPVERPGTPRRAVAFATGARGTHHSAVRLGVGRLNSSGGGGVAPGAVVVRLALVAAAAVMLFALPAEFAGAGSRAGGAPAEWAANPAGWPAHNFDLSNTRADFGTRIDARNVATLRQRWGFSLHGGGIFGVFTSNPIVLGGVVYFENSDSDVFALRLSTGKLLWQQDYRSITPSGGPNGVAYGYGLLYGVTETRCSRSIRTTGNRSGSGS